jgi:hypothetical protein
MSTCRILNHTTILLRLSIKCNILWEAVIDPVASLSIQVARAFVQTHHFGRIEKVLAMLIYVHHKIINQHPPTMIQKYNQFGLLAGDSILYE